VELPLIIQEIVDDLQPLLTPYEVAFYWYAFRHSVAKDGSPRVRLGKGLRRGVVVKSSYSTAVENAISEEKFREIIRVGNFARNERRRNRRLRFPTPISTFTVFARTASKYTSGTLTNAAIARSSLPDSPPLWITSHPLQKVATTALAIW
jgi:hypothetical protein